MDKTVLTMLSVVLVALNSGLAALYVASSDPIPATLFGVAATIWAVLVVLQVKSK